jgi:predicted secreted protein
MILTERDRGRQIELRQGSIVVLRLRDDSASTGYEWLIETADGLELLHQGYEHGTAPGQSATRVFELRAESPGYHLLKLAKRRAWEPPGSQIDSFMVTLVVQ